MVSSDFGKDEVSRQVILGLLWAMAGAASAVAAAAAAPATLALVMNERRSMNFPPRLDQYRTPSSRLESELGFRRRPHNTHRRSRVQHADGFPEIKRRWPKTII